MKGYSLWAQTHPFNWQNQLPRVKLTPCAQPCRCPSLYTSITIHLMFRSLFSSRRCRQDNDSPLPLPAKSMPLQPLHSGQLCLRRMETSARFCIRLLQSTRTVGLVRTAASREAGTHSTQRRCISTIWWILECAVQRKKITQRTSRSLGRVPTIIHTS